MTQANTSGRGSMGFGATKYGSAQITTMSGDEPGYATADGELLLQSIVIPLEAVALIQQKKAVRILADGTVEAIEGERAGVIVFGRFKGDRPRIGAK